MTEPERATSLAEINAAGPWADQRGAIDVAISVLDALAPLHSENRSVGVLSPASITRRDDGQLVIAEAAADPRYASPQVRSGETPGPADDCYAVGAILYEMLAGRPPQPVRVTDPDHVRDPTEFRPDIAPPLTAAVMRALAPNPAARYAEATTLRADLDAIRVALSPQAELTRVEVVPPQVANTLRPPARRTPWTAAALATLAVLAIGAITYLVMRDDPTAVPAVAGKPAQEAQATLAKAGLSSTVAQEASSAVPQGAVVRTDPAAGTEVAAGSTVVLYVNGTSTAALSVPSVIGQTETAATATLQGAGLRATVTSVTDAAPAGTVLTQNPPAGATVAGGATVTITVSAGFGSTTPTTPTTTGPSTTTGTGSTVTVPNLVGKNDLDASDELERLGLVVGDITEQASTQAEGTVLSQSPAAGTQVAADAEVGFVVATANPSP